MKQKRNNDPRECPICGKPCSSGKAMGGHMRAHYTTHYLPPAIVTNKKVVENLIMDSSVESESISQWKSPTRARSRRRWRFMVANQAEAKEAEKEQREDFVPDPDVQHAAETLIDIKNKRIRCRDYDYEDDDNISGRGSGSSGGDGDGSSDGDAVQDEYIHQCPVCLKLFASGQGLGGHRRVHMENAGAVKGDKPSTSRANERDKSSVPILRPCLDLNLPPHVTDEEVTSIEELSTSSSDEELIE